MSESDGLDHAAVLRGARRQLLIPLLELELGARRDLRVLDVGCGTGELLSALSRFGEVYGVDPSRELVERCRRRGLANVRLAAFERLPVPSGTVDLLLLVDALGRASDPDLLLRECRRALARDGLALLTVPLRPLAGGVRPDPAELRERLLAAGLRPARITHFDLLLTPAGRLAALNLGSSPPARALARAAVRAPATAARAERWALERWNLPLGRSLLALVRG